MIKHVVCHRYKDKAEAYKIKDMLLSLIGKVESLRSMEVGINCVESARSYHLVLTARFDDLAGLNAYSCNAEHVKVRDYIHTVLEASVSVDYEC